MKRIIQLLLLSLIVSFSSCLSMFGIRPFEFKDKDGYVFKEDTIAVIAGTSTQHNVLLVKSATDELLKKSKFKVMDQKAIQQQLGAYTFDIRGPYTVQCVDCNKDFSKTDYNTIKQIQKKLNVKYLWVLWIPYEIEDETQHFMGFYNGLMRTSRMRRMFIYAMGQLFENPESKEIAYSDVWINCMPDVLVGWSILRTEIPKTPEVAAHQLGEFLSKHLIEKSGMKKIEKFN